MALELYNDSPDGFVAPYTVTPSHGAATQGLSLSEACRDALTFCRYNIDVCITDANGREFARSREAKS